MFKMYYLFGSLMLILSPERFWKLTDIAKSVFPYTFSAQWHDQMLPQSFVLTRMLPRTLTSRPRSATARPNRKLLNFSSTTPEWFRANWDVSLCHAERLSYTKMILEPRYLYKEARSSMTRKKILNYGCSQIKLI